jgi:tight adherence protein B
MLIMTGLPFLVGGGLFLISPKYMSPLFFTETGQMVAAAAACSMGVGIFIMNKIATIKV